MVPKPFRPLVTSFGSALQRLGGMLLAASLSCSPITLVSRTIEPRMKNLKKGAPMIFVHGLFYRALETRRQEASARCAADDQASSSPCPFDRLDPIPGLESPTQGNRGPPSRHGSSASGQGEWR